MQVNKKQLAEIFGISERSFTEYQRDPTFPYAATGRGHENTYDTAEVHGWLLERMTNRKRESATDRLARIRGDRERLALATDIGEVIPMAETRHLLTEAIVGCRNAMMHGNGTLKKRIDREYKIDLDIEILNAHSRDVLARLSDVGEKLTSDDPGGLSELDTA